MHWVSVERYLVLIMSYVGMYMELWLGKGMYDDHPINPTQTSCKPRCCCWLWASRLSLVSCLPLQPYRIRIQTAGKVTLHWNGYILLFESNLIRQKICVFNSSVRSL